MSADDHGSASTYTNHGCRCDACREAHRICMARHRAEREARLRENFAIAKHGSASTYQNWNCRCDECRAAHTAASRRRRS